jgi:hypothetical protein
LIGKADKKGDWGEKGLTFPGLKRNVYKRTFHKWYNITGIKGRQTFVETSRIRRGLG